MKLMIQNRVTPEVADNFIMSMEKSGYYTKKSGNFVNFYNCIDDKISIDYEVCFFDDYAFIGIRPQ